MIAAPPARAVFWKWWPRGWRCGCGRWATWPGEVAAPAVISSMCVVFAETEIIGLLASGATPEDIVAGVQAAVATRVAAMAGRNIAGPVVFTGGVARLSGMDAALATALGRPVAVAPQPQITGARVPRFLPRGDERVKVGWAERSEPHRNHCHSKERDMTATDAVVRRWFPFTLWSLPLLIAAVALPSCGRKSEMPRAPEEKAAVEAIEKLGGSVFYEGAENPAGDSPKGERFAHVTRVSLGGEKIGDAELKHSPETSRRIDSPRDAEPQSVQSQRRRSETPGRTDSTPIVGPLSHRCQRRRSEIGRFAPAPIAGTRWDPDHGGRTKTFSKAWPSSNR